MVILPICEGWPVGNDPLYWSHSRGVRRQAIGDLRPISVIFGPEYRWLIAASRWQASSISKRTWILVPLTVRTTRKIVLAQLTLV